jgi:hypothetical protein
VVGQRRVQLALVVLLATRLGHRARQLGKCGVAVQP